jgi:hypothetical protein
MSRSVVNIWLSAHIRRVPRGTLGDDPRRGVLRMRRPVPLILGVLLAGLLAGAPSALAGQTDWAINGVPLPPGDEVPVKLTSVTPFQLIVPEMGIDITCTTWKSKGRLVGGNVGTGELSKSKFSHCTDASHAPVKVHLERVPLNTDLEHPVGVGPTTEVVYELCFAKGRCEPANGIKGIADAIGPTGEGNLIDFPQPPLPASTLMFEGSPAEIVGEAAFRLPKQAILSQAEL